MEARLAAVEAAAKVVQSNVPESALDDSERRVAAAVTGAGMTGSALYRVPVDYYSRPLAARAEILDCPVARLCKSIVLENLSGTVVGDVLQPLAKQKYVCVILQYVSKLQLAVLEKLIEKHPSNGGTAYPVKLTMCETADRLTGYGYNAMTPFGSLTAMPVIVARPITRLPSPAFIWLGGGREDTKLRVFVSQLEKTGAFGVPKYAAAVLDCVTARDEGEEED